MASNTASPGLWRRLYGLFEAGFDVMARYPFDPTELPWNHDLFEDPPDAGPEHDAPHPPAGPGAGPRRAIKVVPSPTSQRYRATRPARIPARTGRPKHPG